MKKTEEANYSTLFLTLKSLGIKKVIINYSGSGDSGEIDDVEFRNKQGKLVNNVDSELRDEIEELFYEHLDNSLEDWYNNEGGYGSVTIDVISGDYEIENIIRYTSEQLYTHEGNIIEILNEE